MSAHLMRVRIRKLVVYVGVHLVAGCACTCAPADRRQHAVKRVANVYLRLDKHRLKVRKQPEIREPGYKFRDQEQQIPDSGLDAVQERRPVRPAKHRQERASRAHQYSVLHRMHAFPPKRGDHAPARGGRNVL